MQLYNSLTVSTLFNSAAMTGCCSPHTAKGILGVSWKDKLTSNKRGSQGINQTPCLR